jgi:SHS2 domain-containing protein
LGFRYAEEGPEADLTVDAWGGTLGEAFGNAARAMFNAMTPLEAVRARVFRGFEVEGDDLGALLFNFLDELLYIHDVDLLVFSEFDLDVDEDKTRLRAVCRGEEFDTGRHEQGIAVKAVTFHDMRIGRADGGWKLRVVFDT